MDVFSLKKIAGHFSIRTTEKYVQMQRGQDRQAFVVNMGECLQSPRNGF